MASEVQECKVILKAARRMLRRKSFNPKQRENLLRVIRVVSNYLRVLRAIQ